MGINDIGFELGRVWLTNRRSVGDGTVERERVVLPEAFPGRSLLLTIKPNGFMSSIDDDDRHST